jgi:thiamine-phosphate pyrophosphorylase
MLHRLMYITQGATPAEHLTAISEALSAGVRLVQLRVKSLPPEKLRPWTEKAYKLCRSWEAQLIVNDHPEVAAAYGCGLHLGLSDMPVREARMKGNFPMIGGTANTMEDIRLRHNETVDYIGLGPYRFTTTKEKLSPVLGSEGYRKILGQMKDEGIRTPVYAIGGIREEDVQPLVEAGVYGIAVSSLITHSPEKAALVERLNRIFEHA